MLEVHAQGTLLPEYSSLGAAGADLYANEALTLAPGERAPVATGLRVEIPAGYAGLVWPRSGLAVRHGIDTLAGVIDSDYRGELRVVLVNHGQRARPHRARRPHRAARAAEDRAGGVHLRPASSPARCAAREVRLDREIAGIRGVCALAPGRAGVNI